MPLPAQKRVHRKKDQKEFHRISVVFCFEVACLHLQYKSRLKQFWSNIFPSAGSLSLSLSLSLPCNSHINSFVEFHIEAVFVKFHIWSLDLFRLISSAQSSFQLSFATWHSHLFQRYIEQILESDNYGTKFWSDGLLSLIFKDW